MFTRIILLLGAAICAALYAAGALAARIGPAHASLAAAIEGRFTEGGGWFQGEPFVTARPVRAWGSWCGSDENTGTLVVGPFSAPSRLRFGIGGYPARNALYLVHAATGERLKLDHADVGERWQIADFPVPPAWVGTPVTLQAIDQSKTSGGWLALTEPIRGGRGAGTTNLWQTLAAWSLNGWILGVLWLAAARELGRRAWAPDIWLPLVSAGAVALLGYGVFWAYFLAPLCGHLVAIAAVLTALGVLVRQPTAAPAPQRAEMLPVALLAVVVGLFYLALLHIFPSSHDFFTLAANRFRDALPADNVLPQVIADRLYHGESLRLSLGDWHSSDRPPLQSGWILLTAPLLALARSPADLASGTAGVWFQLLWIAGAHGLLRALGLSARRAAGWSAALALSGFFLQNTVFTWPKLAAGALACGAFGLWVLTPSTERGAREIVGGAALAALAWLAHGGVAFSFLVLAPWVAVRGWRTHHRAWLQATLTIVLLLAPWSAYQRFYDPPGNRLLKWHLGGQIPVDARGTWEAIRGNYAALGAAKVWSNKRSNFRTLIVGDWRGLLPGTKLNVEDRRAEEFFYFARTLTWWLCGIALVPLAAWVFAGPGTDALVRRYRALLLWTVLTLPVWCFLMFDDSSTVVHQGSYAMMLSAFVLLSAAFERGSKLLLAAVAALQAGTLLFTWAGANKLVHGTPNAWAAALAVAAAAALGAVVVSSYRTPRESDAAASRP